MGDTMQPNLHSRDSGRGWAGFTSQQQSILIAASIAVLSGVLIFISSPLAFYSAILEGVPALGIVLTASAAGLWLVWAIGNGDLPIRWQIGLGAGLGLGGVSLAMLLAGLNGHLGQRFCVIAMVLMAVAGVAAIYRLGHLACRPNPIGDLDGEVAQLPDAERWRWLWLLIVPAVVLGVLAVTVPPGLLWPEEGNGYDVLEYHLGVPKEYFFLGRIEYLDHNMYSNFPMNAEMLYLLPMVLLGSPFKAAICAQMIHLLLGALAGYAAWLIGRDSSSKVGIVTGIAGAAFGWSIYTGVLAYVENGMLFYGLLAAGLCSRALRDPAERTCFRSLAVGALVGLACGYKYTAIPMIAVPLVALWAGLNLLHRPAKISNVLSTLLIAGLCFGPWVAKNQRMTGDPLFPLAHGVFGSRVWSDADFAKFQAGHVPLAQERAVGARVEKFWERALIDPRFGYVPWLVVLVAAGVALRGRTIYRKEIVIWSAVLALQVVVWLFATHLFARFASVMWIPLVALIGIVTSGALRRQQAASRAMASPVLLCLAGLLVYLAVGYSWLFVQYRQIFGLPGLDILHGNTEMFFRGQVPSLDHLAFINGAPGEGGVPYDAKVLMVGDARIFYVDRPCDYSVVFSHDRFAEAIEQAGGSGGRLLKWLQQQGYSYVWVNLSEIHRLGSTYGLSPLLRPDVFTQLEKVGLLRQHEVRLPIEGAERLYGVFYKVPNP